MDKCSSWINIIHKQLYLWHNCHLGLPDVAKLYNGSQTLWNLPEVELLGQMDFPLDKSPHCLKYVWGLPTARLAPSTRPPSPLQLADGPGNPHGPRQYGSNKQGLFTASRICNFSDGKNWRRSPYPSFSVHRRGVKAQKVKWLAQGTQTANRTGTKVSASPPGPLYTVPHNFTALSHGSLRNTGFNYLRPGVLWVLLELNTLFWWGRGWDLSDETPNF